MFKKAIAVAMTATMVLSMAVIASADKEIALGTGAAVTDADLLNALNTNPESVTFEVSFHVTNASEYEQGWGDAGVKFHVAGEDAALFHQYNLNCKLANGENQVFSFNGKEALDDLYDSDWSKNNDWVKLPIPAGGQIDSVDAGFWNSAENFVCKATVAGAAATGVVVPVAVVSLLGVSAAGAMVATKKRA